MTLLLAEDEVERDLFHVIESGTDWIIFTTENGLEAVLKQAEQIGVFPNIFRNYEAAKVGVRGYTTFSILKQLGIRTIVIDDDGTTQGLIRELQAYDFEGNGVTIQRRDSLFYDRGSGSLFLPICQTLRLLSGNK